MKTGMLNRVLCLMALGLGRRGSTAGETAAVVENATASVRRGISADIAARVALAGYGSPADFSVSRACAKLRRKNRLLRAGVAHDKI